MPTEAIIQPEAPRDQSVRVAEPSRTATSQTSADINPVAIIINPKFKSLIPLLTPEALAQLEVNIVSDGCRDPLVLWGDTLIDGHNRHDICQRHRIPFKTVEMKFADEEAAMNWIDANQLGRRNLTPDQQSIIRGRRYNRLKKKSEDNLKRGTASPKSQSDTSGDTASELAKKHGVSRATVIRDGKKAEAFENLAETNPNAAQAVLNGLKRFNKVRHEIKLEAVKEPAKLPAAKFRVFYADPSWKFGDQPVEDCGDKKSDCPSMTIRELCEMPIKSLCEEDAVLFLWVPSHLLFECATIIKAWGFKYKACFVWDKGTRNAGHFNGVRHEFLLVCTRGSCMPDTKKLVDSVVSVEQPKHSAKPNKFREIIETLYPHGAKIELFATKETPGWNTYENVCKSIPERPESSLTVCGKADAEESRLQNDLRPTEITNGITLPVRELKAAVAGLRKIIPNRASNSIDKHVRLSRDADGRVTLRATNDDAHAIYHVAEPQDGVSIDMLVPFDELCNLSKGLDKESSVQFIPEGKAKLRVRYQIDGSFMEKTLNSINVDEFPLIPKIDQQAIPLNPEFGEALKQGMQCCSKDQSRKNLNGVLLDVSDENENRMVATDGRRLFIANIPLSGINKSITVPESKFLNSMDLTDESCTLAFEPQLQTGYAGWIMLSAPHWTYITQEVAGQFPNWKNAVPVVDNPKTVIKLSQAAVKQMLKALPLIPVDDKNTGIRLKCEFGQLIVEGRAQGIERTGMSIQDASVTGTAMTKDLNPKFLIAALEFNLNEIHLPDENSPLICFNGKKKMVIMPMRQDCPNLTSQTSPTQ